MTDKLTCAEVFKRLDDYLDKELTAEEMRMVREHLETCAYCASEYKFEADVIEEVRGKIQRITCPPDLMAKISNALTASVSNADSA